MFVISTIPCILRNTTIFLSTKPCAVLVVTTGIAPTVILVIVFWLNKSFVKSAVAIFLAATIPATVCDNCVVIASLALTLE